MPVDRNSHSGVWSVARGSSTTLFGIISGWPKLSLTWRTVSVQPAEAVYSPADSVVGIAIVRMRGRLCLRAHALAVGADPGAIIVELRRVGDVVAEAERDHLRRVGDRAAAQGDEEVGSGGAGGFGRRDDIAARGVRADPGEDASEPVAERAAHLARPARSPAPACRSPAETPNWRRSPRPAPSAPRQTGGRR